MKLLKSLAPLLFAVAATMPGLFIRFFHIELSPPLVVLFSGTAILCASFILLWASDLAQADISQTLALAVVALVVVLPEYAVDMYFTWQAGKFPDAGYAQYSIANMTGANRLLIGVAWPTIAALWWIRARKAVELSAERRIDILFLGIATAYALVIAVKGTLTWYDGLILMSIYAVYMGIISRRPCVRCELEGPVESLGRLPRFQRRSVTLLLFLFSAGVMASEAGIFSEGMVATGKAIGVNEFLLIQWIAPIASEAPEFIVAIMLTLRGQAGTALGSLLSAKLNQWTLLVGMIPGVYSISAGTLSRPIPMGSLQMHEILLTAAQSLLAVILLMRMRLSIQYALILFGLFVVQFFGPALGDVLPDARWIPDGNRLHLTLSFVYLGLATVLFLVGQSKLKRLYVSE